MFRLSNKFEIKADSIDQFMKKVDNALGDIADTIFDISQELVVEDRGALQQSGAVSHEYLRHTVYYTAPHAPFVEFGTEPHWPPLEPLVEWVKRHKESFKVGRLKRRKSGKVTRKFGKDEKAEIVEIARAIVRKIGREGVDPKPFFEPALKVGLIRAPSIFREASR